MPELYSFKVSHLLWTDDLVLLAPWMPPTNSLSWTAWFPERLSWIAEEWELSININKTNIMAFNTGSRVLSCCPWIQAQFNGICTSSNVSLLSRNPFSLWIDPSSVQSMK
jgi:hypothetical protein